MFEQFPGDTEWTVDNGYTGVRNTVWGLAPRPTSNARELAARITDKGHARQCQLTIEFWTITHEVPKSTERRNTSFLATLLDLCITHIVGGDEDDFGLPGVVHLLQDLHDRRTAATCLGVPEEQTFRTNVPMNETTDCWAECLLLIRAYGTRQYLPIPVF